MRLISFSTSIFKWFSNDEVASFIAHEIGQLYFGKELLGARMGDNARLSQMVELKCDIISLITLKGLSLKAAALIRAVKN